MCRFQHIMCRQLSQCKLAMSFLSILLRVWRSDSWPGVSCLSNLADPTMALIQSKQLLLTQIAMGWYTVHHNCYMIASYVSIASHTCMHRSHHIYRSHYMHRSHRIHACIDRITCIDLHRSHRIHACIDRVTCIDHITWHRSHDMLDFVAFWPPSGDRKLTALIIPYSTLFWHRRTQMSGLAHQMPIW